MCTTLRISVLILGLSTVVVGSAFAQPAASVDTFDLVLVGDLLSASTHRVALKTNPTAGETWEGLNEVRCEETARLLVFPAQSTDRYLGQDIRENYMALKVTAEASGGTLRAAYAVPSTDELGAKACARLVRLAETKPLTLRRHSLAVYERPRPVRLQPERSFIDHIEAPIRQRKPGVMEVEWLQILFRQGD